MSEIKHLARNKDNAVIAGLCSGIADYFNLDPVIVRLAWIVFACLGGGGVLAYIIGWIIVPAKTK
jgi:phage shock protein C